MTSAASTRGVTSFLIGSVPSVLSASICSVTRMEPSCAAMPEPTRPATISPASTGPSSRIIEAETSRPMYIVAPKAAHLHAGLQGEHHAGEEAGQQHDAERLHPDLVHLLDEILRVERAHEGEAQRLAGQGEVFLDGAQLLLRRVGEALGRVRANGRLCGVRVGRELDCNLGKGYAGRGRSRNQQIDTNYVVIIASMRCRMRASEGGEQHDQRRPIQRAQHAAPLARRDATGDGRRARRVPDPEHPIAWKGESGGTAPNA